MDCYWIWAGCLENRGPRMEAVLLVMVEQLCIQSFDELREERDG